MRTRAENFDLFSLASFRSKYSSDHLFNGHGFDSNIFEAGQIKGAATDRRRLGKRDAKTKSDGIFRNDFAPIGALKLGGASLKSVEQFLCGRKSPERSDPMSHRE